MYAAMSTPIASAGMTCRNATASTIVTRGGTSTHTP